MKQWDLLETMVNSNSLHKPWFGPTEFTLKLHILKYALFVTTLLLIEKVLNALDLSDLYDIPPLETVVVSMIVLHSKKNFNTHQ